MSSQWVVRRFLGRAIGISVGVVGLTANAVSIPALAQNTPPQAEDDVYRTAVDESLALSAPGVLNNDTDEEGDPLTADLVDGPSEGGIVDLRSDGSFGYTPPAGFTGEDVFTYRAFDGTDFGNAAAVTIRVGLDPPFMIYADEALFLDDLAALGHVPSFEGFEDDAVWAAARSPDTVPSVTSRGVTWTANNPTSEVTTGSGPVRTGVYGFFCLPHGTYATGRDCHLPGNCTDGWVGTGRGLSYGLGAWIEGTFGGRVEFILDGTVVDLGDTAGVGNQHQFYGVIHPDGFVTFEVHETEGTVGDQKLVFTDDFTVGVPSAITLWMSRDPATDEINLDWWGGPAQFTVFRSTDPAAVTDPGHEIGLTSDRSWTDLPPMGHIFYYRVVGL